MLMKNLFFLFVFLTSVVFSQPACIPNGCSFVSNNGFESNTGCSPFFNGTVSCWSQMFGSPDMFTRNCTSNTCRKVAYNTYNETSCQLSTSASDAYNGPSAGNNAFIGINGGKWYSNNHATYALEGFQTQMTNALVNGQQYVISFWGKVNKNYAGLGTTSNKVATIDFHTFPAALNLTGNLTSPLSTFEPSAYKLGNSAQIPNDDKWHYMQQVITYNGPAGNSYLGVHYNLFASVYSVFPQLDLYAFLDDITVNPIGTIGVVTNPAPICMGQSVFNLSSYVSVTGGTFSGPGVVYSHGQYSFNSTGLAAGNHIVFYSYTDQETGCVYNQALEITVLNGTIGVSIPAGNICAGSCATLTPNVTGTSPFSYSWNTVPVSTTSTISVCPTVTKTYQLTVTNSLGCKAIANVNVVVKPNPIVNVSTSTVCSASPTQVTASGATAYSWLPATGLSCANCANPIINTTSLLTYTVTGTTNGCSATKTVGVIASPNISVSAAPTMICLGGSSVLNASGANSYLWSANAGNSTSASVNVSPTSTTVYTVQGTNTNGCISTKTVSVNTCTPSACSYVVNGNFENVIDCSYNIGANLPCWKDLIGSSDIFTRGCTSTLCRKIGFNTYNNMSCNASSSASESYSGPGTGNDCFIGLYGGISTWNGQTNYYQEGAQTKLGTSLVNGQQYIISFWAKVNKDYAGLGAVSNKLATLDFYSFSAYQNLSNNINVPFSTAYPSSSPLGNSIQIANDNTWHYMQQTFTYTGPTGNSYMGVYYNVFAPIYNGITQMEAYVYLDDIAINTVGSIPVTTNPPVICLGQSIPDLSNYVNITGGVFSGQGVSLSNGVYSFNSTGLAAGNYNVFYTYTNPTNGCVTKQAILVTLANGTVSVAIPSQTICSSSCATLVPTVSGTAPLTYQWNTTPSSTTSSMIVCPLNSTNYQVNVTNALGCVATATLGVTVVQTPTLNISATSPTVCPYVLNPLTVTGATSYTWAPAAGLTCSNCSNPTFGSGFSKTYTVTGANGNCISIKTVTMTVIRPPSLSYALGTGTICEGTSFNVVGTTDSPPISWSNGVVGPINTISPVTTTTYSATVTNACGTTSGTFTMHVNPLPTISVNSTGNVLCTPGPVTLTASYLNANSVTWNTGATTNTIEVNPSATTSYTASVTNSCGTAQSVITITVGSPSLSIQQSVLYVPCGTGPVQASLNASGATTYSWDPPYALNSTTGANVISIPNVPTTYTLYGQDNNGCSSTATVDVQAMFPYPSDAGPDFSVCSTAGGIYVLGIPGQPNVGYSWEPTTYLSDPYVSQPIFNYPGAGTGTFPITYTLTTCNSDKCFSYDYVTVSIDNSCRLQYQTKSQDSKYEIKVVPNPNNGDFDVISNTALEKVEIIITNVVGEIVYKESIEQFKVAKISMTGSAAGVYYLQIIGENNSSDFVSKVIKQ